MLSKADIEFEFDPMEYASIVPREAIQAAILEETNNYIDELNISRLKKVIVKSTELFDTELGIANYKQGTITLSRKIAVNLVDKNSLLYHTALSVLKHELYHFWDYQNCLAKICLCKLDDRQEIFEGYKCWTEFYASYMTFDVCQNQALYNSFKQVFSDPNKKIDDKRYYTSQILGYYLQEGHSDECDALIYKYLNRKCLEGVKKRLGDMVAKYPHISGECFVELLSAINKLINPEKREFNECLIPIASEEFWKRIHK